MIFALVDADLPNNPIILADFNDGTWLDMLATNS